MAPDTAPQVITAVPVPAVTVTLAGATNPTIGVATAIEIVAVAVVVLSVAVTVKFVALSVVEGVPEITPVAVSKFKPVGSVPPDIEYVTDPAKLLAEYAVVDVMAVFCVAEIV